MRKITDKDKELLSKFVQKMYGADRFALFVFGDTPFGTITSFETRGLTVGDLEYCNNVLFDEHRKLNDRMNEDSVIGSLLERMDRKVTIEGNEHTLRALFEGIRNQEQTDGQIVVDGSSYTREQIVKALITGMEHGGGNDEGGGN